MIWDDLVTLAFEDICVIQPGETLTPTLLQNGEKRLNMLLSSLSTEGLTAFQQVMQTFPLAAGVTAYTLGPGGTFATTGGLRAQRVRAWRASYGGVLLSGGRALSMEEFSAAARQQLGESTPIPAVVGADTAFPLINIRVSPPPSATPGQLELAYFTPIAQIADFAVALPSLPEGWPNMLHLQLALLLYPLYPRAGGMPPDLAAAAQNAKSQVVAQNATGAAAPAAQ